MIFAERIRMSAEDRIGVRKRLTIKRSTEGYITGEYWIERARPSGITISDALVGIEAEIDLALDRFRKEVSHDPAPTSQPTSQASIPQRQPAPDPSIPQQGWTDFQSGKGAWIKSDAAPQLREVLSRADGKTLVVGSFRYKLSGDTGQFINRFAHKGESPK
jgi:hypothetical protein